jgi:UDP-N-acetyl-2-amino-2-deoxyglucuronate dehydrogenase
MTKWNIGVVGAGMIADFHARAIQDIPNANLVGFCDNGSGRAKELATKYNVKRFTDFNDLICHPEMDVVTIASPSGNHLEAALLAAKHRKHVLCEKPMEITPDRIDQMISAHQQSGTYLGGIFPYRFNDNLELLQKAIKAGRFGTITYGAAHVPWWRDDAYYKSNWRGTWQLDGGGALMNQSIHMIDMLLLLMGPVKEVKALGGTLGHTMETEDVMTAVLSFETGAFGMIYGTTASFPGDFRRLEIRGTKGTVVQVENSFEKWEFEDENEEDAAIRSKFGNITVGGGTADPAAIPYENHTKNLKAFLEAIESKSPFSIDGEESKKAVELINRIYTSAGIR